MNLNNKKNLVFDLDGTLLNNNHKISHGTRKTMEELIAKGYRMYINTGRPTKAIDGFMATGLFAGFSTYNGGYVKVGNKVIANKLSVSKTLKMLEFFDLGDYSFTTQIEDTLYVSTQDFIDDVIRRTKPGVVANLKTIPEDTTYSIRLVFPTEASAEAATRILKEKTSGYTIAHSTKIYVLINDIKASKVNIFDLLGRDKSLFFGDSGNDLVVFEEDDIFCIAPKNATEQIRMLANLVLDETNEEDILAIIK